MTAIREQQLLEALRRAQLENSKREESERKLHEEINEFRTMFNNLATQLQPHGNHCKQTAQAVMPLGKKFTIITEPWILPRPEDALGKPRPNLRHDDPARFQITDREELLPWVTAELYHHVPEAYHNMLENLAEFADEASGFNAIRATAIKAVRDRAAVIFNVRLDFVEHNPEGIDKDAEPSLLRYLTWHPEDEAAEYDEFPPLLYPDCVQNDALVFRNPQLVKVLKVILYGPKSVQSSAAEPQSSTTQGSNPKRPDKRRGRRPASGPTPNAVLWGLKQVTPGMTAFSAIAATFVLSADEEFVPRGKDAHRLLGVVLALQEGAHDDCRGARYASAHPVLPATAILSPRVEHIFVCPGNGGTAHESKTTNVNLSASDFPALVDFALKNDVSLVLPGPEQPLVDGIESHFRKVGIPVFGPTALAARMEGSKAFSKAFMDRHNIPTAKFKVFQSSEFEQAIDRQGRASARDRGRGHRRPQGDHGR
ncbi:hypothetical protein NUW54_g3827 [Trametes sanguinea]|uniref:Uncharacterized protein n=1 Tax=Trametes sanguinea TaxID=158606 RepID=A0ACC1Q1B0_9APHY|nr:hypothetical protein NUW54_g3827 [Trametes sanguinea]